jgi:hypothetical protein
MKLVPVSHGEPQLQHIAHPAPYNHFPQNQVYWCLHRSDARRPEPMRESSDVPDLSSRKKGRVRLGARRARWLTIFLSVLLGLVGALGDAGTIRPRKGPLRTGVATATRPCRLQ